MFIKIIATLLLITFTTTSVYASCPKEVQVLLKDEKAPCKGFLFSPDKEKEVREKVTDYEQLLLKMDLQLQKEMFYKERIDLVQREAKLEREKSELWRTRAVDITKKYTELQEANTTRDYLLVIGGVVLTVAAGFAVGAASK